MANINKKLVKSKSGMRMVFVDDNITSPFTMQEPEWTKDDKCSHCQNIECQKKFSLLLRKHHCRRCGRCFCDDCSKQEIPLPRMCFIDPVRHCGGCFSQTKGENDFMEKHIKTLQSGGIFRMFCDENINISSPAPFKCQLSPDERYLEFDNFTGQENICLEKIESVQIAAMEVDQQGNRMGTGIAIKYTNNLGNSGLLKMEVEGDTGRKQSMTWVAAMQRAFKMIYNSRDHRNR